MRWRRRPTFGFYNAGQIVLRRAVAYAQRGIYDALVEKLGNAVSSLKMAQRRRMSRDRASHY